MTSGLTGSMVYDMLTSPLGRPGVHELATRPLWRTKSTTTPLPPSSPTNIRGTRSHSIESGRLRGPLGSLHGRGKFQATRRRVRVFRGRGEGVT